SHILFVGGISDTLMQKLLILQSRQSGLLSRTQDISSDDSIQIYNAQILNCLLYPNDSKKNVLFYHTITNTVVKKGEVDYPVQLTSNVIKTQAKVFIPGWNHTPGQAATKIITGKFLLSKTGIGLWSIVIMSVYFVVLSWIGWFFSKRQRNTADYFTGGGKMSWFVVALSIYATATSSIGFMAIPAKAYATDWSYFMYTLGSILGIPVITLLFIPFYRRLKIVSAYEYLEMRFNLTVRVLASIAFMIFHIGRIAIVLFLPAIAINVIAGFDIFISVVLMGVISLIYTSVGGIKAVIWTDALQLIILFGAIFIAIVIATTDVNGGFPEVLSTAFADGKFHMASTSLDLGNPTLITVLIAAFFTTLTTYGTDQTMVQRYMTTPTQKTAVKSVWTKVLLVIPGTILYFTLGTVLYVFYKANPHDLSYTVTDGDAIFPWFMFTQMKPFFSAIILCGLLAAAMSTASSSINSTATAYSVDIHFRFGWLKDIDRIRVAKIASVFMGLAGTILALMMSAWEVVSLWDQFIKILGLIMGSFGGLFLLGLLTKRANATGALIGIFTSVLVQIWIDHNHIVHGLLYVATGSLTCFIIGYLSSLLFHQGKKDITCLTIAKS
ncbi:MAG TPA: sodium:solute symporter, partial [Bacteroidales bacterium]|nr:sodium:solute symporter [Bacteroidales bacterium]